MTKKGAIAAAVVGIGALGLGAVALMRSSDDAQKKDADTMFSGMLGGGATGGYSDTTGVITPPNNTVNPPSSNIGDTIGGILSDIIQTPPQTQTPIIITPPSSGIDDLIPLINAVDNPSDERSDTKTETPPTVKQPHKYADLAKHINDWGSTSSQSSSAYEYSPFDFAPTPKQADYSTYNAGKTGGSTANTPSSNTQTSKTVESLGNIFTQKSESQKKGESQKSESQNKVESVTQKAVDLYSGIANAAAGFFGGLFGGK